MCGPQNSLSFVGSSVQILQFGFRQGMKSAEIRSVCFDEGLILKTSTTHQTSQAENISTLIHQNPYSEFESLGDTPT